MARGGKKRMAERANAPQVAKLMKKMGMRARATVSVELDRMLSHVLKNGISAMQSISSTYTKADLTIKPKIAHAAFQALLPGDLRHRACKAGADAVEQYIEKKKQAKIAAEEKRAATAVTA